jgi:hypothetical protein
VTRYVALHQVKYWGHVETLLTKLCPYILLRGDKPTLELAKLKQKKKLRANYQYLMVQREINLFFAFVIEKSLGGLT